MFGLRVFCGAFVVKILTRRARENARSAQRFTLAKLYLALG
jgi:hypothetical protein